MENLKTDQEILQKIKEWGEKNQAVEAIVLTSSRVVSSTAFVDQFSDYDLAVYVNSLDEFKDDKWLEYFGDILVCWPKFPESTFSQDWITRLVLFKSRLRIDFQITDNFDLPPSDYDLGYQVIIDKKGIVSCFPQATRKKYLIKKPTENDFLILLNDFFWDATYVVKSLWREDLFSAKYMLDSSLRFDYFEKIIEWYIGSQNDWQVSTNVHGRYFKKYLDENTWNEIKKTFTGAEIEENWKAFIKLVELFTKFAREVAAKLGYGYPTEQERDMAAYYEQSKNLQK